MRKLMIVLAAAMIAAGSCFGASVRDNCGCGLGTMLMGDSESTMLVNLVVTFLNGLCANQTFSILGKSDHRWSRTAALCIRNDHRLAALDICHARIRRAQIDSDRPCQ